MAEEDKPTVSDAWVRRASRRFTTLEGWQDLGHGVYSFAGQVFAIHIPQDIGSDFYDYNDQSDNTRPGAQRSSVRTFQPILQDNEKSVSVSRDKELPNPPELAPAKPEDKFQGKQSETPFHILSGSQKRMLVFLISLAGLFSPLSSNIYFPALDAVARDLKVSINLVSLTITSYMILQGISPSFWSAFADAIGRRPIYIGTFLVYIVANIGLSFSPNFTALMIFRAIQSAGSSATISIGAGVIGDISTPAERGGYIGLYGGIRMLGQSIGPVLGGLFASAFGFRSIFIFLLTFSTLVLALIIVFLPETLRSIAGNGTIRLTGIYQPLISRFREEPEYMVDSDPNFKLQKVSIFLIIEPLKFLFEKDVFVSLVFGAIVYTVWSMVTSSTTSLFKEHYGLSELLLGLAFIPNGLGCVLGSYITGRIMDKDYSTVEGKFIEEHGLSKGKKLDKSTRGNDFPIEKARMRSMWWIVAIFIVATSAYGWTLKTSIAVPLILQFFIAYTATAVFNINSALVIDLFPGKAASATAVNNLARCLVGAAGVAGIEPMIGALGSGASFTSLAFVTLTCVPLMVMEWMWGMCWRLKRVERLQSKESKV